MSVQAISWAFRQSPGSPGAKLLLVALANSADKFGVTYLGRVALAADCSTSPKTVSDNMARLEEAGLIQRLQRRRANGSRTSDWTILAPRHVDRGEMGNAPLDEFPAAVADLARRGHESSGNESSPNDSGRGQVTNPGRPEPSEEPSENGGSARASTPEWSYGRRPVPDDARRVALEVFDAWIQESGQSIRPFRPSNGQPSDALTRITGAVLDHPEVDVAGWRAAIRATLALRGGARWWEGPPSVGVVFGPGAVDSALVRGRETGSPPLSGVQSGRTDVQTHEPEVRGDLDSRIRY